MCDSWTIVGAIVLCAMAIVFHLANEQPGTVKKVFMRLFPRHHTKKSKKPFYSANHFGITFAAAFGLVVAGVTMSGNYVATEWFFILSLPAWFLVCFLTLSSLRPVARDIWALVCTLTIGVGLFVLYGVICPTVEISPDYAPFTVMPPDWKGPAETQRFRVQNKTDEDIYSVVYLFRMTTPGPGQEFQPGIQLPKDKATTIGIRLCFDCSSRFVIMGQIGHLEPHESVEVLLTHLPTAGTGAFHGQIYVPGGGRTMQFKAEISAFSKGPFRQYSMSGVTYQPWQNGETFNRCSDYLSKGAPDLRK